MRYVFIWVACVFGAACGESPSGDKSGTATLAWDAPTTHTDGTPLTDLAGFKVYVGDVSAGYTSPVDVGNVTTYVLDELAPGPYFFAVTAYDASGNESTFSNEVSKVIR